MGRFYADFLIDDFYGLCTISKLLVSGKRFDGENCLGWTYILLGFITPEIF